jgi:hypothetical protein
MHVEKYAGLSVTRLALPITTILTATRRYTGSFPIGKYGRVTTRHSLMTAKTY